MKNLIEYCSLIFINLWDFILTALQEGIKIFYDIFMIYKNPVLNIV